MFFGPNNSSLFPSLNEVTSCLRRGFLLNANKSLSLTFIQSISATQAICQCLLILHISHTSSISMFADIAMTKALSHFILLWCENRHPNNVITYQFSYLS